MSNHCVGIEIEFEEARKLYDYSFDYWTVVDDGSLQENGAELVSVKLPLNEVPKALTELKASLTNKLKVSYRTSVHVHNDCMGLTSTQIIHHIVLDIICERLLFRFAGNTARQGCCYSVPFVCVVGFIDFVKRLHKPEESNGTLQEAVYRLPKYSAINYTNLYSSSGHTAHNTIEYRMKPGTKNLKEIEEWVNIVSSINSYIRSHSPRDYFTEIRESPKNTVLKLFLDIFGKENMDKLTDRDVDISAKEATAAAWAFLQPNPWWIQ